jgi:hypothetical protein
MFLKTSRYFDQETVELTLKNGKTIKGVKFRRIPPTAGSPFYIKGGDRLDIIAHENYGVASKFWHIADANTGLEAVDLTRSAGNIISVPEK